MQVVCFVSFRTEMLHSEYLTRFVLSVKKAWFVCLMAPSVSAALSRVMEECLVEGSGRSQIDCRDREESRRTQNIRCHARNSELAPSE